MTLDGGDGATIGGLDADAVIEVPCLVAANGAHPLGLMQQVKPVERLTIEAAMTGSRAAALQAFALHPLVCSLPIARQLLDGYIDRIPEVAAVFGTA